MEKKKVININSEEVLDIDPSLISSVKLLSGSVIKVLDKGEFKEENIESNPPICEICHLPKYNINKNENVFRGGKKSKEEIIIEGESTEEKKEVLRGPNGMPLLGEILTGSNLYNDDNNNDTNFPQVEKIPVSTPTVPINQPVPSITKTEAQPQVQ